MYSVILSIDTRIFKTGSANWSETGLKEEASVNASNSFLQRDWIEMILCYSMLCCVLPSIDMRIFEIRSANTVMVQVTPAQMWL